MVMRLLHLGPWMTSFSMLAAWLPQQCQVPSGGGHGQGNAGGYGSTGGSSATGGANTGGQAAASGGNATSGGSASDAGASTSCGNGIVEPGEVCDDGSQNGASNHCDASCQFVCEYSCPIRVNPNASSNGSGKTWQDPANSVQSALDTQLAHGGGGEVWVLGGSFPSLTTTAGDLLTIRAGVSLLGGFAGTEATAAARDPLTPPTQLSGPGNGTAAALVTIVQGDGARVDGVELVNGEPAFRILDSRNVTLRNVTAVSSGHYTENIDEVRNSTVRFENDTITVPFNADALLLLGSEVAIDGSTLMMPMPIDSGSSDDGRLPWMVVEGSSLFVHDSHVALRTRIAGDAQALAIDSSFDGSLGIGSALDVEGKAATIRCSFGFGTGHAPVTVSGQAFIFESSFDGSSAWSAHGRNPDAWAISGNGSIDVALSTFINGHCDQNMPRCPVIHAANINDSLFVLPAPYPASPPIPADSLVTADGMLASSNCATYPSASFTDVGNGELSGTHPCPDAGDASKLETSRAAVLSFAAPFADAPFYADLSTYQGSLFWQSETVVVNLCGDNAPPDPGRHFACTP